MIEKNAGLAFPHGTTLHYLRKCGLSSIQSERDFAYNHFALLTCTKCYFSTDQQPVCDSKLISCSNGECIHPIYTCPGQQMTQCDNTYGDGNCIDADDIVVGKVGEYFYISLHKTSSCNIPQISSVNKHLMNVGLY